ncbi:hypothetical protein F4805DRAFT_221234 [Annulohypoxylon moriforme]|nr:hypothetical protein F4805DRAFT_221234 [Annulohypoxylon moriforme]
MLEEQRHASVSSQRLISPRNEQCTFTSGPSPTTAFVPGIDYPALLRLDHLVHSRGGTHRRPHAQACFFISIPTNAFYRPSPNYLGSHRRIIVNDERTQPPQVSGGMRIRGMNTLLHPYTCYVLFGGLTLFNVLPSINHRIFRRSRIIGAVSPGQILGAW